MIATDIIRMGNGEKTKKTLKMQKKFSGMET